MPNIGLLNVDRGILESESWEEICLTPMRCVRLLVWIQARWGGCSSWRFLGGIWGGYRGRERVKN